MGGPGSGPRKGSGNTPNKPKNYYNKKRVSKTPIKSPWRGKIKL